ncbi:hypothetical protein CR513_40931, partial [Mucuna pruriens]
MKRNTATLVNITQLCNISFFLFSICTLIFSCSTATNPAIPCLVARCSMFINADIGFSILHVTSK